MPNRDFAANTMARPTSTRYANIDAPSSARSRSSPDDPRIGGIEARASLRVGPGLLCGSGEAVARPDRRSAHSGRPSGRRRCAEHQLADRGQRADRRQVALLGHAPAAVVAARAGPGQRPLPRLRRGRIGGVTAYGRDAHSLDEQPFEEAVPRSGQRPGLQLGKLASQHPSAAGWARPPARPGVLATPRRSPPPAITLRRRVQQLQGRQGRAVAPLGPSNDAAASARSPGPPADRLVLVAHGVVSMRLDRGGDSRPPPAPPGPAGRPARPAPATRPRRPPAAPANVPAPGARPAAARHPEAAELGQGRFQVEAAGH